MNVTALYCSNKPNNRKFALGIGSQTAPLPQVLSPSQLDTPWTTMPWRQLYFLRFFPSHTTQGPPSTLTAGSGKVDSTGILWEFYGNPLPLSTPTVGKPGWAGEIHVSREWIGFGSWVHSCHDITHWLEEETIQFHPTRPFFIFSCSLYFPLFPI